MSNKIDWHLGFLAKDKNDVPMRIVLLVWKEMPISFVEMKFSLLNDKMMYNFRLCPGVLKGHGSRLILIELIDIWGFLNKGYN